MHLLRNVVKGIGAVILAALAITIGIGLMIIGPFIAMAVGIVLLIALVAMGIYFSWTEEDPPPPR